MPKHLLKYLPIILVFSMPAQATVMYGTLGNFDVINDTGLPAHGFEIEYEGLHSTDIGYTWTYSRYGNSTIVEVPATATTPLKTIVRYTSTYDAAKGWTATTAAATFPWMVTGAHQCTSPVATDGCEHFVNGMFTTAVTPKSVTYHWLTESAAGTLARNDQPSNSFAAPAPAINVPVFPAPVVKVVNNVPQIQVVAVMPAPVPAEKPNAQGNTALDESSKNNYSQRHRST